MFLSIPAMHFVAFLFRMLYFMFMTRSDVNQVYKKCLTLPAFTINVWAYYRLLKVNCHIIPTEIVLMMSKFLWTL